jgi:hypothetical protein
MLLAAPVAVIAKRVSAEAIQILATPVHRSGLVKARLDCFAGFAVSQ